MSIFAQFRTYGFIHHRALNSHHALGEARATARAFPGRTHIYEGDICWNFEGGRQDLYFRHPNYVIDTLTASQIDALTRSGALVVLDQLEMLANDDAFLVVELKVGRGDLRRALAKLIEFLDRFFHNRFWIDSFSTSLLKTVKEINPAVSVTLHTEFVRDGWVLQAAPQWPAVKVTRLSALSFVDGVALRWRFGASHMRQASATILAAHKSLLISRIHTLRQFDCSVEWHATAGYVHYNFPVVAARLDEILRHCS
jgi:hypothetical protein